MTMTQKETDTAFEEVFQEMTSWRDANRWLAHKIPQDEVQRRELFLIEGEELLMLEKAKKAKNRRAASMHEAIYKRIRTQMGRYRRPEGGI
jgi:hypothetical protein